MDMTKLNTRVMNVKDIHGADYNPRKSLKPGNKEYEALKNSIEHFGYVVPLVYNEATKTLVSGHQRLTVLKNQGVKEVEVVVINVPLEEEKALNIAMNKLEGEWDFEKLDVLLNEINVDLGIDGVLLTGFDTDSLSTLKTMERESFFEGNNKKKEKNEQFVIYISTADKDKAHKILKLLGYEDSQFDKNNKVSIKWR